MNKFLPILLAVVLSGCAPKQYHVLLGSDYGYEKSLVKVVLDATVNNLRIRYSKISSECVSEDSGHSVLELDGYIGPDSTEMIERVLKLATKDSDCLNSKNQRVVPTVYLNSNGGVLADGYKAGELFRKYEVHTVISNGQICASSCAIAFLGGKFREMSGNAQIIFHSPYYDKGIGIDCNIKEEVKGLRNYYHNSLGKKDGELLLNRTLKYCTKSGGWVLNAGSAHLFGLVTQTK